MRVSPYLTLSGLALATCAATLFVHRLDPSRGENLARRAVVTTSGLDGSFRHGQGLVDGELTRYGVRTVERDGPWVLLDLRREQTVSRLVVYDRPEQLASSKPVLVELSRDGREFPPIAEQRKPTATWELAIPPSPARYVRLRQVRHGSLEWREVEVY